MLGSLNSRRAALRLSGAMLACAAAAIGIGIAAHHPLWPAAATAAWLLCAGATLRWPRLWLALLPASLPAMNLSPWTGWLALEEFDLVVTAVLAAGYGAFALARFAPQDSPASRSRRTAVGSWLTWLLALLSLHGLWRGLSGAGAWSFDGFQGYADASNSVRVCKSLLYALLLLPLLRQQLRDSRATALGYISMGMCTGLAIVTLATTWERVAYPGLWNFSQPYRTTALFWEMHVGGAAIDAYLALACPFAAWALWSAPTPRRWAAAALLALLAEYACLTTFSRGVYLAAAASMCVLLVLVHSTPPPHPPRWRARASALLGVALLVQGAAIISLSSFLADRMAATLRDFDSRIAHWQHGLDLLHSADDWLLGRGLGRLPALYAAAVAEHPFSGDVRLGAGDRRFVRIAGPEHRAELAGLYALTQRVALTAGAYSVDFDVRVDRPAAVAFSVCEMHLLYERHCQTASVRVGAPDAQWQHVTLPLAGPALSRGAWFAPRMGVFSIALETSGAAVALAGLALHTADHAQWLQNADFSQGLTRWFPAARQYFLPWHIDNLYLEWLIERGLLGLAALLVLMVAALRSLLSGRASRVDVAPFLAASLSGALVVGLVSSIMDVPRVAFVLLFLSLLSLQIAADDATPDRVPASA